MDTRLMNATHGGKNFKLLSQTVKKQTPNWSHSSDDSDLSPKSNETNEDYNTTLNKWRRHVASFPMSDSEDFTPNDVFQEAPSPCRNEKFFLQGYQQTTDKSDTSTDAISTDNDAVSPRKMRGDNRLMDNDNASTNGKYYATVDSVVYELEGDPSQKYVAYHCNNDGFKNEYITNTIQIISVDPESIDVSDSSCESSDDEESNDSDVVCIDEEDAEDVEEIPVDDAIQESLQTEVRQVEDDQLVEEYCETREVENADLENCDDVFKEQENNVLDCQGVADVKTNHLKRSFLKSISLPTSPCHEPEIDPFDYQTSFTYEDLKTTDDRRIGTFVNPLKVFNRTYNDALDDALSFPDNISFDPVIPLNVKSNKESDYSLVKSNDSKNEMSQMKLDDDIIDTVINSSNILFDPDMNNSALVEDIHHSFDLPNFIMSESPNTSVNLLRDPFDCSPIVSATKTDLNSIPMMSTPKTTGQNTSVVSSDSRILPIGDYDDFSSDISQRGVVLADADDYIDVETVSDGENVPVLEANNLDSLLEQFEATEKLQKKPAPQWKTVVFNDVEDGDVKKNTTLDDSSSQCSEAVQMDHDYCSPVKKASSSHQRYQSPSTEEDSDTSTPKSGFNGSHIGLGKGKNIAMCMEYRTDQYKDRSGVDQRLNISSTTCQSDVSDSELSASDHSYSKIRKAKPSTSDVVLGAQLTNNKSRDVVKEINVKHNVIEKIVNIACDKNVKKSVVVTLDTKSSIASKKIISSTNKINDKTVVMSNNRNESPRKEKQSLLKPIVKEEIKKVSLLKSSGLLLKTVEVSHPIQVQVRPPEVVSVEEVKSDSNIGNECQEVPKAVENAVPTKKKLNLEEYKKRRGTVVRSCEASRVSSPIGILCNEVKTFSSPNSPVHHGELIPNKVQPTNGVQPQEIVAKSNKNDVQKIAPKLFDPIAEASKKALQMKKIASMRCSEDKILKTKIPKLDNVEILPLATKNGVLLPMIKKKDENVSTDVVLPPLKRKDSEYEEIAMVSIGVNTDPVVIQESETVKTVPVEPTKSSSVQFKILKKKNSLVQSNVFELNGDAILNNVSEDSNALKTQESNNATSLVVNEGINVSDVNTNHEKASKLVGCVSTLSETLQSVGKIKDFKITSNSLISSIQKIVNKKRQSSHSPELEKPSKTIKLDELNKAAVPAEKKTENVVNEEETQRNNSEEHGEDRVIMHLKKNRVKPKTNSIQCQTDFNLVIKDSKQTDNVPIEPIVQEKPKVDSKENKIVESNLNDEMKRSYRRKSRSRSSSNDSVRNPRNKSDYYDFKRKHNSTRRNTSNDRSRRSYSSVRRKYPSRSRSRSRWSDRHCDRSRENYRNRRDSRYRRRSRSRSNDRRRHYSRDRRRSDRSYTPVRSNRSRENYDNKSVRSLPMSKSRTSQSSCSSYERRLETNRNSQSRCRNDSVTTGVTTHVPDSSKSVNFTENEGRTRTESESSTSSSSSSSSTSSSTSSSSYASHSSDYQSDHKYSNLHNDAKRASPINTQHNHRPSSPRKIEPMEERRVVFVGRLENSMTKEQMRRMFSRFGQVREVTMHRKDDGSRYGFVTFSKAEQSYHVVENANKDPELQRYDVSFGGRRAFCGNLYADLDDIQALDEDDYYGESMPPQPVVVRKEASSFDALLEQMKQAVEAKQRSKCRASED